MPAKHDHNGKYPRKEACLERHENVKNSIGELKIDVACNRADIKGINKKITATLVGIVVTESTLITAMLLKIF